MSLLRTGRLPLYGAAFVVFLLGSLTGCASSPNLGDETSTAHPSTATPTTTPTAADDEATCAALGDVRTILYNSRAAFETDRMSQDELNLWADLASRVLSNTPHADHGAIADAVDAVKEAAPDGQSLLAAFALGAPDPTAELAAACEAGGFAVVMSGFVGG
jgi:hypothetical protein